METTGTAKKVVAVIAVGHFIEALFARRMARRRGKSPALYFVATLFVGFPILLRLRKIEPEAEAA